MNQNYEWLIKKTPRSIDQLRLWPENPRLNPEETHLTIRDFAEDLTEDNADKADFYALVNSILADNFVPADPVVVWKNEDNNKYYVAEGNRRVLALKLLRDPKKAPKSIRSFIQRSSEKINHATIEKIPVNVAPTFEDAEWYINQRNSSSSLQRRWSRVQQQRWILTLYDKHNGDIDKILAITKLSKSELEGFIRILKIKDFVKEEQVKNKLTKEEFEKADSYRFPITILERIFNFNDVREKWGIKFEGVEVKISSNRESFFDLFAELIKRIVNKSDDNINTRINKEDLPKIFGSLPNISFENVGHINDVKENTTDGNQETVQETAHEESGHADNKDSSKNNNPTAEKSNPTIEHLKLNPKRDRIVLPIYELNTDSYRLLGVFEEFKRIPINRYPNNISSSLRVFLDLAVLKYIETENLERDICRKYNSPLREVPLKRRLEYIKSKNAPAGLQNRLNRLLDPGQEYSLDVLNGYIHSQDSHYTNKKFLNNFWDFLFPLFQFLLDIRETQ